MTEEQKKQEEHYKEMGSAYLDKCTKARGFVILPEQLRNDFIDMYVAGCFEATKELQEQMDKMKCCNNCKYRCYMDWKSKCCFDMTEIRDIENPVTCKCKKWELAEN